ncbi:hypothetical protein EVAR_50635_1 [Eumeta japonica]|uniref:Uncharacterized protein n=1 Tax=Eumeta variegata TaxID=151549 RepID=A0A4C1XG03_EUMVA|nr:hypothetical protein EVAR_50635_1 [Eumeta japonica]
MFMYINVTIRSLTLQKPQRKAFNVPRAELAQCTVQRMKLCRSELPVNDAMRRYTALRPFLLLPTFLFVAYFDAFVTNFTAAEVRALYCSVCGCVDLRGVPAADVAAVGRGARRWRHLHGLPQEGALPPAHTHRVQCEC